MVDEEIRWIVVALVAVDVVDALENGVCQVG